jgi:prepilin-type N-terminal cleavage/methylation domain-containing protein
MKKGFTLIELLVVITIMAIIMAVATVSYQKTIQLSRDSKRKTDLELMRQALETYRSETGIYPINKDSLSPDYITNLPEDPKAPDFEYSYLNNAATNTYVLCASLEALPDILTEDARCSLATCGGTCNYAVERP